MTSRDWDKLSPGQAKQLVGRIARQSRTAAQWEKAMQEVVPNGPAIHAVTWVLTSCWNGMWMAWHRGEVISGTV